MTTVSHQLEILLNQLNFRDRGRIKYDVQTLLGHVKTLVPKIGTLIQNNGTSHRVLDLEGTVPIIYSGTQYNIPVEVYVTEQYPSAPPQIYVRPTANMVIKANHPHVDTQGLVYLPYLHNWNPSTSTLKDLVSVMCGVFGNHPPLFSKVNSSSSNSSSAHAQFATAKARVVQGTPIPTPYPHNSSPPSSYSSSTSGYGNYHSRAAPVQGVVTSMHIPDHLKEQNKDKLVQEVTNKFQEEILMMQTRIKGDIEQELKVQKELNNSLDTANKKLVELRAMKDKCSMEISGLKSKEKSLDGWISSREKEAVRNEENLDSRLVPYDELSVQLVGLQSEFLAIDDALYYLERALVSQNNRSVDLDIFLRATRELARRQFLCKSHIRKIQGHIGAHFR